MSKRLYHGFSSERYGWKNPHRKYSKLSKYKIEKILSCFVRDLTIKEAFLELSSSRKKEPISEKTIGRKYKEMRALFVQGALTYLELFGGAGAAALIGVPPRMLENKINGERYVLDHKTMEPKVRIRPYKQRGSYIEHEYIKFCLERALRDYAWNNLSVNQVWVLADFSLVKMMQRKVEADWKGFIDYGYDYVAETNWSSGRYDFNLREDELWEKIYSTSRSSESSYHERVLRDMKWLMNRHPLGTRIGIRTRHEFMPSSSELREACLAWFPNGYLR